MIVGIDLNDDESPVWNLMWLQYVPVETHIANAGYAYETAKERFEDYAKNHHNPTDILSAVVYLRLMSTMDEAKKALQPYIAEWYAARYGIGLN